MADHTHKGSKKRKGSKHNSSHVIAPSFEKFDPIDSAADSLADAVMRESSSFKRQKERLKKVATKALSENPFK